MDAAADGEIKHVYPVGDRLLDSCDGIGRETPLLRADAIGCHMCPRRDARNRAAGDPENIRDDPEVTRRGAGRMRAMPHRVTGRVKLIGAEADQPLVGREELPCSDELIVAGQGRRAVARGLTKAGPAHRRRIRFAGRIRIGEGWMFGPDAGVEDADDDAFTGTSGAPQKLPQVVGADELRTTLGRGPLQGIEIHRLDPRESPHDVNESFRQEH
jgi:hypothetical protein